MDVEVTAFPGQRLGKRDRGFLGLEMFEDPAAATLAHFPTPCGLWKHMNRPDDAPHIFSAEGNLVSHELYFCEGQLLAS